MDVCSKLWCCQQPANRGIKPELQRLVSQSHPSLLGLVQVLSQRWKKTVGRYAVSYIWTDKLRVLVIAELYLHCSLVSSFRNQCCSWVSLVSLGAGLLLTPLFWCLDWSLWRAFQSQTRGASEYDRERKSWREREREKQNERLAAGVNCLSHQTDFLIP